MPSGPASIADVLADVSSAGPFFTVAVVPDIAGDPLWSPLTELYGPALPGQVAAVRIRLGAAEPRVAGSLLFQGLAGRLWSPVLAAAAVHGVVPTLDPARTFWRAASPGPVLLAISGACALPADADALHRVVVEGHLRPLVAAVRRVTPVAEGLLWGNAASALAGGLPALAADRPGRAARAHAYAHELLSRPPLLGSGTLGRNGFRRRSCCLYYRTPGGGLCGDCSLLKR